MVYPYWQHLKNPSAYGRGVRARLRSEVLAAYGGKCACCGESNPIFLTLDHVNGVPLEELYPSGKRRPSYRLARQWRFPKDRYQLLCHNCNYAKSRGGCPHLKK